MPDPPATAAEFRTLDWLPGYRIGSDGSVWSSRVKGGNRHRTGPWHRLNVRVRQMPRNAKSPGRPYLMVPFRPTPGGKVVARYVHRLVCEAFHGPAPFPGAVVCHGDGDHGNSAPGNLRWDSPAANAEDKRRHGRMPLGEAHKSAKLTASQVVEIRNLAATGLSQRLIGRRFGVHQTTVSDIVRRKRWSHVPEVVAAVAAVIAAGGLPGPKRG